MKVLNTETMDNILQADLYRYDGTTAKIFLLKILSNVDPGFRYTYFFRIASASRRYSLKGILIRKLMKHFSYKYGFQISDKTKIGKGLYLGHFGTVVINPEAIIGNYCNIAPNTTIGQTNVGPMKGCPKIGNKVWIGTGAVIVGNITIGDDVLIAPNSFVNFDVPSHSIVKGNPGKMVSKDNAVGGYIRYIIDEK
jgi:serine O-acetyltransferase